MRRARILLVLPCCLAVLLVLPATPMAAPPGPAFDTGMAANVFATALAFMEPRTLDPVPAPQLTLWGLRGLTTLDPRLTPEVRGDRLVLVAADRVLAAFRIPPPADFDSWGVAAAQMSEVAWASSEAVRQAGTGGVISTFFDELFNHLDPYSRYVPPAEAGPDEAHRSGAGGAGLSLGWRGRSIIVADVAADGPADIAGVQPGDAVLAVNGRSTRGQDLRTVSTWIAGPADTPVALTLLPRGGRPRRVTIMRALILPETVFADRQGDVLVLRITGFSSDTGARLARALQKNVASHPEPRGIVFDLRGNRGGLLRQAAATAETVLPHGLIATTQGRDPQSIHVFQANSEDLADGLPLVVLVDGRSASAAEILAAALSDERRAVVVGSSTLGKGLVQTVTPLPDGGELFITWSRVLAPRGWPIQGLGVLPEVCTSLGQDALDRQLDALAAGQQPMAPMLARHERARAPMPVSQILDIRNSCPAAEGRDSDLRAARFLITNPRAYETALLPPAQP